WSDKPAGVPADVDGYFLSEYIPQVLVPAVRALPVKGSLAGRMLLGAAAVGYAEQVLGPRAIGVVGGSATPVGSAAPAWTGFVAASRKAFPKVPFLGFAPFYFTPMEAALRGLEASHGDAGNLQEVLRVLRFDTPTGPARLNGHRQAIAPNYLVQVTR